MGILDFIPEEVKGKVSRVVILGKKEMLIEQHRGLISYETDNVCFRVLDGQVQIGGKDLVITAFGAYDAKVQGQIDNVTLLGKEA